MLTDHRAEMQIQARLMAAALMLYEESAEPMSYEDATGFPVVFAPLSWRAH